MPTIMRNVPGSAFYFFALSEIRQILKNNRATWQPLLSKNKISERWESLVSGATARGTVAYVMMPITVIKVRYEVKPCYLCSAVSMTNP